MKNNLPQVCEILGRNYAITGRVIYGKSLGKTIGFPTANINLAHLDSALRGVFYVKVKIDGMEKKRDPGQPLFVNMYTDGKNYPNIKKSSKKAIQSLYSLSNAKESMRKSIGLNSKDKLEDALIGYMHMYDFMSRTPVSVTRFPSFRTQPLENLSHYL